MTGRIYFEENKTGFVAAGDFVIKTVLLAI
jgi:hypothetical protein